MSVRRCLHSLLAVASLAATQALAQMTPFTTITVPNGPDYDTSDTVNGKVYTANLSSNSISVIDANTWTKVTDITTGGGPRRLRLDANTGRLYVNNSTGSSITVINVVNNTVVTTIPLPLSSQPWNTAYDSTAQRLYVALRGANQVAVIDTVTNGVITYVATGTSPRAVCHNFNTNRLYVPNAGSNNVTVIDTTSNTVVGVPIAVGSGPSGCGVDTVHNRVFISNDTSGDVTFIDGATNTVINAAPTGPNPSIHAWDNAANLLVVGNSNGTVTLFALDTLSPVGNITVGASPWASFIDYGARALHVTNRGSNDVSIIDLHDLQVKQTIPAGTSPQGIARHFQNFYVVNQGNGTSGSVSVYKRPDFRLGWDLGDDGRSDIVWHNTANLSIAAWLMNGTSATATAMLLGTSDWLPAVRADFDGDGKSDIVFRDPLSQRTAMWFMDNLAARPGMADVILGPSSYEPIAAVGCAGGMPRCLVWRDPSTGTLVYWYMDAGLVPTRKQVVFSGGPAWRPMFGNFDGDFHTDILWQHTSGAIALWLMQGDGTSGFSAKQMGTILGGGGWVVDFIADFDGDGRSDLLFRYPPTGDIWMWLMNGYQTKVASPILPGAAGWTVTHVRDLDGDGKADLLWRHTSGVTAAWLMNGTAPKATGYLSGDPNWAITHTLDTNNDLKGDLLWRNSANGQTALWTMNGLTATSTAVILGDPNWVVLPPSD